MILKLGFFSAMSLTAVLAATQPGCDNAERIYNCAEICDKYDECIDDDLDNEECIDSCTDKAASSEAEEDRADACQECIDGESCTASVFNCSAECAGFVTPQ